MLKKGTLIVKYLLFMALIYAGPTYAAALITEEFDEFVIEHTAPAEPEWPEELIPITYVDYKRNTKASFCTRPTDMIDTIVIHHSETPATTTATQINDYHLARGTKDDPWYMIAYTYVVNSPYAGTTKPKALVTEGRPIEYVGAHAGSNAWATMDETQKKLWNDKTVLCGKEGETPKFDSSMVKNGKIKANITTAAIVVNGNYAPYSTSNPGGYSKRSPRYPTNDTQDMIARLSCQLQKKYPRIKYMKWHNFYTATTCPGNIKSYIGKIKTLAKGYGCEFK